MIVKLVREQTVDLEATALTITTPGRTFTVREQYGALIIQGSGPLFVQWRGNNEAMIDIAGVTNETQSQSRSQETTQAGS
jgi:hypothetical protein